MPDKKITPFEQAAAPRRAASKTTTIEQSRAVAEVQGAIVLAQQRPRDIALAQAEMQRCCAWHHARQPCFLVVQARRLDRAAGQACTLRASLPAVGGTSL